MNAFDYMKLVSEYIINRFESKGDINEVLNVSIKPVVDPYTKELFYEIKEEVNFRKQMFYLKFPCGCKEDFYNAVRKFIIEYMNNSDLLMYTALSNDGNLWTIVTKTRANLNFVLADETDKLVFNQFKEYLDMKLKSRTFENDEEEVSNVLIKSYEKTTTILK